MHSLNRGLQPAARTIIQAHRMPMRPFPSPQALAISKPQSSQFHHARPSVISQTFQLTPKSNSARAHTNVQKSFALHAPCRAASTSTPTSPPKPTDHSPEATLSKGDPATITWTDFFRLRAIRRRIDVGTSVVTTLSSFALGAALLSSQNLDTLGQPFGLDPMLVMGIWIATFTGAGWLIGPGLGSFVFGLVYRSGARGMKIKEKDFFGRVRRYRVDPSTSNVQNPVPDYYGEKITSVAGYRGWLKDQRAFRRKRESYL